MKEITVLYHIIYIIYDITYNFEGMACKTAEKFMVGWFWIYHIVPNTNKVINLTKRIYFLQKKKPYASMLTMNGGKQLFMVL